MRSFYRFPGLFTLFAVALEVALVWALFHPAFRCFEEPDIPPICTANECFAAVASLESVNPRSYS
jgi:hypothetical protein